ncbi:MBOAT family O-acyltransferase, partial [Cetobacterium somerae]
FYVYKLILTPSIFKSNIMLLKLILPLGISFFTFQQLSFIIDNYKRRNLKKYDFLSYCLFVTFFPQLIAGPIVSPEEMIPQFENKKNKAINYENMSKGLYLFSIGLAKKVLLADSVSPFVDAGFDKMTSLTFIEAWLTSISYTIQLYFDFSGYCDMAMGVALMFNIILPLNFDSPYKSTNIQEFWKKWHMTLGRFLTNYLYIPLGGNKRGELKTLRNLLIVFLVSGIWHGAGWNFLIWGGFHGISILIHRTWKNFGMKMPKILGWIITMFLINIFWIFFRANNIEKALKIIKGMGNINSLSEGISINYKMSIISILDNKISLAILILGIIIVFLLKNSIFKVNKFNFKVNSLIEQSFYLLGSILFLNRIASFLYFNF